MNIGSLVMQTDIAKLNVNNIANKEIGLNTKDSFDTILGSFMNVVNETNFYQIQAEQLQTAYAAGQTDDMLAVMLAQEKAFASLNFAVQVTNKVIEAYREIMRMNM